MTTLLAIILVIGAVLAWGLARNTSAARASEERYARALQATKDGIFEWNPVTDELFMSERARQLLAVPDGVVVRTRSEVQQVYGLPPGDQERIDSAVAAAIGSGETGFDMEFRVIGRDREVRWVRQQGKAFPGKDGRIALVTGTLTDITERKRAEEEMRTLEAQLRRALRLESLGTMAGGIAHDFNNILGAIVGYGEMALRDVEKGSRQRRDLDAIMAAGERGRALVDRILAFSRSGVGERAPVNVESVVREALDQVAAKLPESVTIEPRLSAGRAAMLGDSTQVHQVAMNLALNAVQAMPQGGMLRVDLRTERFDTGRPAMVGSIASGDYIVLGVSDTGTGIAADVLERMFDPFFTTKEVGVGSGLGLSLVHGIVTNASGAIDVTTEPGKGSTFIVYLPRVGDVPESPVDEDRPLPRGDGQRVLVVDDEEPLVRVVGETLEGLGYAPVTFTSSTRALEAFDANPSAFDAILTDERMPGVSGSALIREARRIKPSIPIVLMSGFVGTDDARELGADDVLRKPLLARDLAASLARVLQAR